MIEVLKLARELAHQVVCGNYDGNAQDTLEKLDEVLAKLKQGEPVAKYSDIVSDGGLDPRNKLDTTPHKLLTDEDCT